MPAAGTARFKAIVTNAPSRRPRSAARMKSLAARTRPYYARSNDRSAIRQQLFLWRSWARALGVAGLAFAGHLIFATIFFGRMPFASPLRDWFPWHCWRPSRCGWRRRSFRSTRSVAPECPVIWCVHVGGDVLRVAVETESSCGGLGRKSRVPPGGLSSCWTGPQSPLAKHHRQHARHQMHGHTQVPPTAFERELRRQPHRDGRQQCPGKPIRAGEMRKASGQRRFVAKMSCPANARTSDRPEREHERQRKVAAGSPTDSLLRA